MNSNNKRKLNNNDDHDYNNNNKKQIVENSRNNNNNNSINSSSSSISGSNSGISSGSNSGSNNGSNIGSNIGIGSGYVYDEFIKMNYKELKVNILKEYCDDLSISKNGNKDEIYNRIKNYLYTQKSIAIEKKEKDSINSFNKDQPELAIKDIGIGELLFWKVIRDKTIYKRIMSNYQFKRSFNYEILSKVDRIFDGFNNGIEIFKDKVKSNSYLQFDENGVDKICKLFNSKDQDTQLLLQQLLERYSKSIIDIRLIHFCIKNSNIHILKLKKYSRIQFIESLNKYRSKPIELVINNNNDLKIIKHLNSLNINSSTSDLNIKYTINTKSIYNETFKLKHLVQLVVKLPVLFPQSNLNNFTLQLLSYNGLKDYKRDQLNLNLNQLFQQDSAIFNNNNNNKRNNNNNNSSSSNNRINHHNSSRNNYSKNNNSYSFVLLKLNVLELVDRVNKYSNERPSLNYYILFKDYSTIVDQLQHQDFQESNIDSFSYLLSLFKLNIEPELVLYMITTNKCKLSSNQYTEIYKSILSSNNMDLIEYIFSNSHQYSIKVKNIFITNSSSIISSIESTLVLDHIFKYDKELLFSANDNINCFFTSSSSILDHYEELMIQLNRKFNLNSLFNNSFIYTQCLVQRSNSLLKVLLRALNKPQVYSIDHGLDYSIYCNLIFKDYGSYSDNQVIIEILKYNHIKFLNFEPFKYNQINLNKHFILWLLNNSIPTIKHHSILLKVLNNNSINNNRIDNINNNNSIDNNSIDNNNNEYLIIKIKEELYIKFLYICGFYDGIFNSKFKLKISLYSTSIQIKYQYTTEFIDLLFNKLNGIEDEYLMDVISGLIYEGNIWCLKLLVLKYNSIFNKKSKSHPHACLTTRDFKFLLYDALDSNSYQVIELVSNYCKLTKKEYDTYHNKSYQIAPVIDQYLLNKIIIK